MEDYQKLLKRLALGSLSVILILMISFIIGLCIDLSIAFIIKIAIIIIPAGMVFCVIYTIGSILMTLNRTAEDVEHYNGDCDFCSSLRDRSKRVVLLERSKTSDDNLLEILNIEDVIEEQVSEFLLTGYKADDNFYLMVDYVNTLKVNDKELRIHKFSNGVQLNYCPMCGDKISNKLKKFQDNYSIYIDDIER